MIYKKANNIQWLFFDVGSTLIDESECIRKRCETIIETGEIDRDKFYKKVYELAKTDSNAVRTAAEFFGAKLPRWYGEYEKPYDETAKILSRLFKKYKLGIIANQVAGTAERFENWGLAGYFDAIVSSAEVRYAKPDAEIFNIALSRANADADRCIMIGDRIDNDIVPAKKLGMRTIWVRQGLARYLSVGKPEEQPDWMVETLGEISDILL